MIKVNFASVDLLILCITNVSINFLIFTLRFLENFNEVIESNAPVSSVPNKSFISSCLTQ